MLMVMCSVTCFSYQNETDGTSRAKLVDCWDVPSKYGLPKTPLSTAAAGPFSGGGKCGIPRHRRTSLPSQALSANRISDDSGT